MPIEHAADLIDAGIGRVEQIEMPGAAPEFDLAQAKIAQHLRHPLEGTMLETEVRPDQLIGRQTRHMHTFRHIYLPMPSERPRMK